jgi:hypothetical protein
MTSGERKLWLTFGIGLLVIMGILLIGLWQHLQLVASLVFGLILLTALVLLTLYVIRTIIELGVKVHEQKLRQERLLDHERLVDKNPVYMFPSNTRRQEEQEQYPYSYAPIEHNSRRWED